MAVYQGNPLGNLALGLASLRQPGLLSQAIERKAQAPLLAQQAQLGQLQLEQARQQMEQQKRQQAALANISGLLSSSAPYVTREAAGPPQLMGMQEQAGPPQMIPGGFPSTQGPPSLEYPQAQPMLGPQPTEQYSRTGLLAQEFAKAGMPKEALSLLMPEQPKTPGNINEFEMAKSRGYIPQTMGFEEYLKVRKSPSTVIQNIPAPPSGYKIETGPEGEVQYTPVKGGPVYQKAKTEFNKKEGTLIDLEKALGDLRSEVEKQGPQISVGRINAADTQRLSGKHTNVLMQLKELYGLGVIQGPDMVILEKALLDPTSYSGLVKGKEAILEGLNTLEREIENRKNTVNQQYSEFGFKVKSFNPPFSGMGGGTAQNIGRFKVEVMP